MNIENVHRFIEAFENAPIIMNRMNYYGDCEIEMIINIDHYVCSECGTCGEYRPAQEVFEAARVLYRRRVYCIDKLKQMSCLKSPRTKEYKGIIKTLSTEDFSTIHELYDIMKELNMFKFYKNIFDVYFSIKKIKLIKLTYDQIERIANDFIEIESKFMSILFYRIYIKYNLVRILKLNFIL